MKIPGAPGRPFPLTEAAFQQQVVDLAELRGWDWMHIPRSQTGKRFRTMVVGTLAKGWPDLLLCRDDRLIVIECKTDVGRVQPDQLRVLEILERAEHVETYIFRPKDWGRLEQVLQ